MERINALRDKLPEAAKDLKLNLQNVLTGNKLSQSQAFGVALTSAYFLGNSELATALEADGRNTGLSDGQIDDAKAVAALMGMNTTYYRFRGLVGNDKYSQMAPQLRMSRMARPATSKAEFELYAMAAAALAPCQDCIRAHEASLRREEISEEQIHEAVRIAAVVKGVTVAMGL